MIDELLARHTETHHGTTAPWYGLKMSDICTTRVLREENYHHCSQTTLSERYPSYTPCQTRALPVAPFLNLTKNAKVPVSETKGMEKGPYTFGPFSIPFALIRDPGEINTVGPRGFQGG